MPIAALATRSDAVLRGSSSRPTCIACITRRAAETNSISVQSPLVGFALGTYRAQPAAGTN